MRSLPRQAAMERQASADHFWSKRSGYLIGGLPPTVTRVRYLNLPA
ncbi:hypothetical protein BH09PSE5_BH09PSE5_26440 [soil metagenome]